MQHTDSMLSEEAIENKVVAIEEVIIYFCHNTLLCKIILHFTMDILYDVDLVIFFMELEEHGSLGSALLLKIIMYNVTQEHGL